MSDQLVTLYEAGTLTEATLLRDRLQSEGIDAYLANVNTAFGNLMAADQAALVQIDENDWDRAKAVLEQFLAEGPGPDADADSWSDEDDGPEEHDER